MDGNTFFHKDWKPIESRVHKLEEKQKWDKRLWFVNAKIAKTASLI